MRVFTGLTFLVLTVQSFYMAFYLLLCMRIGLAVVVAFVAVMLTIASDAIIKSIPAK